MGVFKRKVKNGYNYYIQYYVNGKRHKETVGRDYNTAKKLLEIRKGQIAQGKFPEIFREKRVLFEDFAEEYLKWSIANKRTWRDDNVLIKKLLTHFKGKYLTQITTYLVEQYKAERIQKVKPATVNREVACLKAIFNKAILWKKFKGENPVSKVKLFREDNTRVRFLTKEEISELLRNCSEKLERMVTCALNTGMRLGEIFNLKWKDIDWKNGLVTVEHTKSGRTRFIPMNQQLRETFQNIERYAGCPYVFNHDGNRYTDIKKPLQRALKKAGIEDFRFHDLRHTFASHLVMAGVNLKAVQELLGHQSIEMTMRYAHLSQDNKRVAVSLLDFRYQTAPQTAPQETSEIDLAEKPIEIKPTDRVELSTYGLRNRRATS